MRSLLGLIGLLFPIFSAVTALKLRGSESEMSVAGSSADPTSFISLFQTVQKGDTKIDWWLWVVIGGLVAIAVLVTIAFRKPAGGAEVDNADKRLVMNSKLISCQQIVTRSSPLVDPVQLGMTIKGKTATGEFIELFHAETAHETEGSTTKFNWDESEYSWILPQPLIPTGPSAELVISIEQYSPTGGLLAVVASGIVTLKPPLVGALFSPRAVPQIAELVSTASGSSVWGSVEFSVQYEPLEANSLEELNVAQKQIIKKLKIVKPLFLAAHSLAVVLVILDSFFGIRFLFSGCFASSIQSIVSAGLVALLSVPMAAEWGQMHYSLPSWIVKIGKLNSQFKATVLLLCAIPQQVLASVSGSDNCKPLFSVVGGLTFLDFALFSILFVQTEANGHVAALLHFNCLKRPIPPALPAKAAPPASTDSATNPVSPGSYAARRALRQQTAAGEKS